MVERARATGTRLLFATPHVCPGYWLTRRRRALIEQRFAELAEAAPAGIELRLGYEVTPARARLRSTDDLERLVLAGTNVLLVDGPQRSPWGGDAHIFDLVRRAVRLGLAPLVAHPERRVGWAAAPTSSWRCGCARRARCCRSTSAASPAGTSARPARTTRGA